MDSATNDMPSDDVPPRRLGWSRRRVTFGLIVVIIIIGLAVGWHVRHSNRMRLKQSATTSPNAPPAGPPVATGWAHTNGTEIVNATGQVVQLTGVDDGRMDAGEGNVPDRCHLKWQAPTAADAATIHSFRFNTVRLGVSWANLEPTAPTPASDGSLTHHWNEQYLSALDAAIAAMRAQGIMVILDMHQAGWSPAFSSSQSLCEGHGLPSWLYPATNQVATAQCEFFTDQVDPAVPEKPQEGLAAAWSMLASRYGNDPTVIGADMFNEPSWPKKCSSANLVAFYQKIGQAIRAQDSHLMLMEEDGAYMNYLRNGLLLRQPLGLSNVVYSWHMYPPDWKTALPYLQAHLTQAQQWNVPLWIGEFDAFGGSYNTHKKRPLDPNWQTDLAAMLTYCKQHNISWTIWEYDRGGYSVVTPGTSQPKQPLISDLQAGMQ